MKIKAIRDYKENELLNSVLECSFSDFSTRFQDDPYINQFLVAIKAASSFEDINIRATALNTVFRTGIAIGQDSFDLNMFYRYSKLMGFHRKIIDLFKKQMVKPALLLMGYKEYCLNQQQMSIFYKLLSLKVNSLFQSEDEEYHRKQETYSSDSKYLKKLEVERRAQLKRRSDLKAEKPNSELVNTYFPELFELKSQESEVLYFEREKEDYCLMIEAKVTLLKRYLDALPKYVSEWEALQARKSLSGNSILDILKLFFPGVLCVLMIEYLGQSGMEEDAKDAITFHNGLRELKISRYSSFRTTPDVLGITYECCSALSENRFARISHDISNDQYSGPLNYFFLADPTIELAQLLIGIDVGYSTSQDVSARLSQDKIRNGQFSLLKFAKDFGIAHNATSRGRILAQKWLACILRITSLHEEREPTLFEFKSLAEAIEFRRVSEMTLPIETGVLSDLGEFLNSHFSGAVDFVTFERRSGFVSLYFNRKKKPAINLFDSLMKSVIIPILISPNTIIQLMFVAGIIEEYFEKTEELKGRSASDKDKMLTTQDYLKKALKVRENDFSSLTIDNPQGFFGYRGRVSKEIFQKLAEFKFISNVVRCHILHTNRALGSYVVNLGMPVDEKEQKCRDIMLGLINGFVKSSRQLEKGMSEEQQLKTGMELLRQWVKSLKDSLDTNVVLRDQEKLMSLINQSISWSSHAVNDLGERLSLLKSGSFGLLI